MSPNTIRNIDVKVGKVLTWFLSLLKPIIPSRKWREPKKILFIKLIEQGATVLAYSTLKTAIEKVGKDNVYFIVLEDNKPILDIVGIIPQQNIFVVKQDNIFAFGLSILSCLVQIRKQKIDCTIDLEFFSRASAILGFLSGARTRVGLHRFTSELPYRGNLLTHKVQHNPYLHVSLAYMSLLKTAFLPPNQTPFYKGHLENLEIEHPVFTPTSNSKESVQNLLQTEFKTQGLVQYKLVLLNPNASDMLPLRKWDENKFIELGKQILEIDKSIRIGITGANNEARAAAEIAQQIDPEKAVSFAGKTSLYDLFTLYTFSKVLVTNDSGPGHFATMTPIRTVVLFGPETPQLFGPKSERATVIWKGLLCSPCVNAYNHRFSPCNDNQCMKTISVDEVFEAVKQQLN